MALRSTGLPGATILLAFIVLCVFAPLSDLSRHVVAGSQNTGRGSLPPSARLKGYPSLIQQHALSCEAAVASMATGGRLSEQRILDHMPLNANPFLGFRGNVDGGQSLANGLADYGVYAPPLAHEMQDLGYQTVVITGTLAPQLLKYSIGVLRRPVEVWVTHYLGDWPAITGHAAGRSFTLINGEHARLAIGYDARGIYTLDPLQGPQFDSWSSFLRSWARFGYMGIVIGAVLPHPPAPILHQQAQRDGALWWWSTAGRPLLSRVTLYQAGRSLKQWLVMPQPLQAPSSAHDPTIVLTGTEWVTVPLAQTVPVTVSVLSTGSPSASLLASPTWPTGPDALQFHETQRISYTISVQLIDPLGLTSRTVASTPAQARAPVPPSPVPPPPKPTGVRAAIVGPRLVRWIWPTTARLTYRVVSYRYLGSQPVDYVDQLLGSSGSYMRTVVPNLTYYAQVVAIDGGGRSSPATSPIPAPVVIAAQMGESIAGSLQPGGYGVWHWTAHGAARFLVRSFAYTGSRVAEEQVVSTTVTSYRRRLTPGLAYFIEIRALSNDGAQTAPLMTHTSLRYYPAQPIQHLRVQQLPDGRQSWSWQAQREMRYDLTLIRYLGKRALVVSHVRTSDTTWISAPTPTHMTDYLQVRAIDACGDRSAPVQHPGLRSGGT